MEKKPLLVLFLTVFIDLVGFGIIIPLNPFLARRYGADPFEVGLLMTVYSALQFAFAPFWGQLSDRWGRRPVMLISLLGATLGHGLFALAPNLLALYFARALAGCFGGNISAAMAAIADLTPEKDRSKGMGLIGAAFGLGFILGPFLGGIFVDLGSRFGEDPPWGGHFPALMASGLCFLNFVLAWRILPETNPRFRGHPEALPERMPRIKQIKKYVGRKGVGGLMAMFFLATLAMAHMEASLFMLVQDRFGWSMSTASQGFAVVGVLIAFTQGYLLRKLQPKFGESRLIVFGLMASASAFILISLAHNLFWLALAMVLLALGSGLAQPSINGAISQLSSASEQGGTMGVNQSLSALGRVLGPATGGYLYRQFGMGYPFIAAAILTLLAFFFWPSVRGPLSARKSEIHSTAS